MVSRFACHTPIKGKTKIHKIAMKNNVKKSFDGTYQAPEVQIMEVLVEQGFQASLGGGSNPGSLDYGDDFDEFE